MSEVDELMRYRQAAHELFRRLTEDLPAHDRMFWWQCVDCGPLLHDIDEAFLVAGRRLDRYEQDRKPA